MEKFNYLLDTQQLRDLFEHIQSSVDTVIGPKLEQGAIGLAHLQHFSQLPRGYSEKQGAGSYQIESTNNGSFFQYSIGPQSVKKFLHPSERKLWSAKKIDKHKFEYSYEPTKSKQIAFFGIRSCDIKSLEILDQVFLGSRVKDPHYQQLREGVILITASCAEPSSVCFCTSMGHGPRPEAFDLNINELWSPTAHFFLLEVGSKKGEGLIKPLGFKRAEKDQIKMADELYKHACKKINRKLNNKGVKEKLRENSDHPQWDHIADRCLSCANCTMVCPTCFCSTIYDQNDLEGNHTDRWLKWDSCFNDNFSYIHGGTVRSSTKSKYRQWLTHKFSTWFDQFGSSGCVGCGRCIAWCPVGIDLTVEIPKLAEQIAEEQKI